MVGNPEVIATNERSKRERGDETLEVQKAEFFSNTCEIVGAIYAKGFTLSLSYSIPGEECVIEFCN